MAAIVQVPGAALVKVNTGSASALQSLGYTENGVTYREEELVINVPGDQNGGDEGNPIEIQKLGIVTHVHLEFSKWDEVVSQQVQAKCNNNGTGPVGQGVSITPGTLYFSNTLYFRLLIVPLTNVAFVRNFLTACPIEAHEINIGTRYAKFVVDFICYPPVGGGASWNLTAT